MKKCEICSAPATVFLTQIINGESTKVSLCAKCATEKGVLDPSAFDLAEKLFTQQSPPQAEDAGDKPVVMPARQPVRTRLPLTVCPNCGFSIDDYRRAGRLGCSRCYEVFAEEIMPVLQQIQSSVTHKGKQPEHASKREARARDISRLQDKLTSALKREDYEEAARLRDSINALDGKL